MGDTSSDFPMEGANSPVRTLLEDTVALARTAAKGLLLAVAGFSFSYLDLRFFAL